MDLPKILQNLPKITSQPNIPAGVQQALANATAGLAAVQDTIKQQQAILERGLEIEREYERTVGLYENLHNQAEDIGKHGSAQ